VCAHEDKCYRSRALDARITSDKLHWFDFPIPQFYQREAPRKRCNFSQIAGPRV
jgi:hypothetical protein